MLPRKLTRLVNDESERIWKGGHWCGVIYPADNFLGVKKTTNKRSIDSRRATFQPPPPPPFVMLDCYQLYKYVH